MFYRMSINRCKTNRGCPFMMQFVDMFVEEAGMKEEMRIVETDLKNKHKQCNMHQHFCSWRNIIEISHIVLPSPNKSFRYDVDETGVDNKPVEPNNLEELATINLLFVLTKRVSGLSNMYFIPQFAFI